jgi:FdhE protein
LNSEPELYLNHKELISKILNKLAGEKEPLPVYLQLYKDVLTTINKGFISSKLSVNTPDQSDLTKSIEEGKPYLDITTMDIDYASVINLFSELVEVIEQYIKLTENDRISINDLLTDIDNMRMASVNWFNNTSEFKNPQKPQAKSDNAVYTLLHGSLYPILFTYSDNLQQYIPQRLWYKHYCPICGGKPDFSYLDNATGSRWMVCSRCDTNWLFFRLVCPFCNNKDMENLAYYKSADSPYRLYVCDNCRHYIKCIDLRSLDKEVLLPLERVLSISLDSQAAQYNYE